MTIIDPVRDRLDWRLRLETEYQDVAGRLRQSYGRTIDRIRPLIQNLTNDIADGGELSPAQVRRLSSWRALMERLQAELDDFARIAENDTANLAERMIQLGLDDALQATLGSAPGAATAIRSAWNRPDPEALRRLLQFTDSDAFRGKWADFGENAVKTLQDTMLSMMAQGKNPLAAARLLSNLLMLPYAWMENTTRTAQLWSYRLANHATFAANRNIVTGWIWVAELSVRTCASCWNQHGTLHDVDEVLNDHHRGRCAPSPVVRGFEQPDRELGRDAFDRLSEAEQRQIMGSSMYDAWRRGAVSWDDLSKPYLDGVYGEMLSVPSLKSLGVKR